MSASEIRRIRRRLGLTQAEMARKLGVARVTVTRWEAGSRNPSRITQFAIRRALISRAEGRAWDALQAAAVDELWDNPQDAVYDNWRAHYGPQTR